MRSNKLAVIYDRNSAVVRSIVVPDSDKELDDTAFVTSVCDDLRMIKFNREDFSFDGEITLDMVRMIENYATLLVREVSP